MSRYRTSWEQIREQVNEFTLVHTVRYRDPLNKKRFAVPFKTKEKAQAKMDQLKRDGVKEIEITQDTLRGNIKFKEGLDNKDLAVVKKVISKLDKASDAHASQRDMLKKAVNEENFEVTADINFKNARNIVKGAKIVVGAKNREDAEEKAIDIINNAREKGRWPNPKTGGNFSVDSLQNVKVTPTNKSGGIISKGKENLGAEYMPEEDDHEISMARGELEAIADKATQLSSMLQGKSDDGNPLEAWVQSKITKAKDYINSVADYLTYNPDMKEDAAKDMEKVASIRARQMALQTKVQKMDRADPKNKTPLAIAKNDLDNMQMKMDQLKKKVERDRMRNEETDLQEKIKGLETKSEKSGISYGILKQVYNRGMAAWKGGHRPGTTPQQWAFARVNSFITKGKTYYTADADLAKKARASKKGK